MVKGTRGIKIKVLFLGLHMTNAVFVLVYNFIIYVLDTPFNFVFYMLIDFD
jgi:type IV secretory pathway VirB3-like protein